MVDYKIEDILTFFMLGSDLVVNAKYDKMDQYWHKELDYKYGFCYSFQPPDGDHGVIKLLNVATALNMAMIRLNVSCYDMVSSTFLLLKYAPQSKKGYLEKKKT